MTKYLYFLFIGMMAGCGSKPTTLKIFEGGNFENAGINGDPFGKTGNPDTDFSDMPGYCSECRDEIMADFDDEDEEYDLPDEAFFDYDRDDDDPNDSRNI